MPLRLLRRFYNYFKLGVTKGFAVYMCELTACQLKWPGACMQILPTFFDNGLVVPAYLIGQV